MAFLTSRMFASSMIRVFPSLEHSAGHVRIPETICRTFVCVPYWHLWTKHNRAKPMSELPSAIFLIADGNEFRFARFYIVCEEVPLGTPESPPIVSGVSDMHPSDCPNVEETRNPMQTFSRKKCSHFSPTNFHLHFHMKSPSVFPVILLIKPKHGMLRATPPLFLSLYNVFLLCVIHPRRQTPGWSSLLPSPPPE